MMSPRIHGQPTDRYWLTLMWILVTRPYAVSFSWTCYGDIFCLNRKSLTGSQVYHLLFLVQEVNQLKTMSGSLNSFLYPCRLKTISTAVTIGMSSPYVSACQSISYRKRTRIMTSWPGIDSLWLELEHMMKKNSKRAPERESDDG